LLFAVVPMATVEVAAAYTAVGAITEAATTLAKIHAPVDMWGRRMRPSLGRLTPSGVGAADDRPRGAGKTRDDALVAA
jgi:hypothetical protein